MPEDRKVSFVTENRMRYRPDFSVVNCERILQTDVDGDGNAEVIVVRTGFSGDKSQGEVAIYDLDLNLQASDSWDGTAMDVKVADVDGDGSPEMIVAGGLKNSSPMLRIYKQDKNYKGNLQLSSQTAWKAPEGLFATAKAVHISGMDIAVLSIVEGKGENGGYAQLRIYDADLRLKSVARWTPMKGQVTKWGHCMTCADIDGDGCDELVTLINFRHEGKQKADLRFFDRNLNKKNRCAELDNQALFATCMSAADVDKDGEIEVVIAGGAFTDVWQGATNQLMVFNNQLELKQSTRWRTFRHSWVWDMQIADVDRDGDHEIVTFGGTAMDGRNQDEANIMGEVCVWNCASLATEDMFIWQSRYGEDTRPSRGFAMADGDDALFAIATSRWSRRQYIPELEIRTLKYKPVTGAMERYSLLAKAYDDRDIEALETFVDPEDTDLTPIALGALAKCRGSAKAISGVLNTSDKRLFAYAVELLRDIKATDELQKVGFTITDDWAVLSPFDNVENSGFEKESPPENEIDLDASYAGKDRIVRWGKIQESVWEDRSGIYVDLAYNYFDSFERTGIEYNWNVLRTDSVAYALTYIHSPKEMDAQIRLGNTDSAKVWLNDELKHSVDTTRYALPEQDTIPVSLRAGRNELLLKIANHKIGAWGFFLRVIDADGYPITDLQYERPEVSHIHNQMLTTRHLLSLLATDDEHLRYLAAHQLASSGAERGKEALAELLNSEDAGIRAKASLSLTVAGDGRGLDTLAESAEDQPPRFQVTAGYALRRAGDERSERFSIDNLKDKSGKNVLELQVKNDANGFYVSPMFKGDETAHVRVGTNGRFHLGENVSTGYATIESFGIRQPKYRAMGFGGVAIKRACEVMTERGFSCSTVSTGTRLVAHRLYVRNGYVDRRFPLHYVMTLAEDSKFEKQDKIIIRDYTSEDKAYVSRLRDQYIADTFGPASWLPRGNFGSWTKIAERDGKIIGYADLYFDPFEPKASINLIQVETGAPDEFGIMREMVLGCQRYALAEGKETISIEHPLMRYRDALRGMGYSPDKSSVRHGWVNMFKIIDLPVFLEEMCDLLSSRLERSAHAGWSGSIGIKGSRLEGVIEIDGDGNISAADMAADSAGICICADDATITSLLTGDGKVWEWYRQHVLTVKPMFNERLRTLIESLFPVMECRQGGWW